MKDYIKFYTKYDEDLKRSIRRYTIPKREYDNNTNGVLLDIIISILHDDVFDLYEDEQVKLTKLIIHNPTVDSILIIAKTFSAKDGSNNIVFLRLAIDKSDNDYIILLWNTGYWRQDCDGTIYLS